ncbi:hypothetical protein C0J52_11263 [Blattella germanica]|nr:hypothetical protein C0J52_11263 [Blattella germanica]
MPFKEIELEELKHSKQLRAHALRVMAFVQKAVARLHEPEKLEKLLQDLGKKHYAYGAKQKYVDIVRESYKATQVSYLKVLGEWLHGFRHEDFDERRRATGEGAAMRTVDEEPAKVNLQAEVLIARSETEFPRQGSSD